MATYILAAKARGIIDDLRSLNNTAINALARLKTMQDTLTALTLADRTAVRAAVVDMGFDDVEIIALLDKWERVRAVAVNTEALVVIAGDTF